MQNNEIEIVEVSIDDVLEKYSILNGYVNIERKVRKSPENNPTIEEMVTELNRIYEEEGFEDTLVDYLNDHGFYVSDIRYSFDQPFAEEVKICGR